MSDEQYINEEVRPATIDRMAVEDFAKAMIEKLSRNSHKAHWSKMPNSYLLFRLKQEVSELEEAIASGSSERICDEAKDCGNFSMMIFDNVTRG